ncbi:MAG TPA: NUDIX domain-containing protein [Kofleriaceae bacterium]|jgi:8-oxo-dGTP diphosphatase|nr:NUDIX domain-containing protein [Kofleriaceae bacterium]
MKKYSYDWPRPGVTVDCVVFGLGDGDLQVLLIRRKLEPFAGRWALPGGFVHMDENLEEAARRELLEETGVTRVYLEQLYTFGDADRDPRDRIITVAYYALTKRIEHQVDAATDAGGAAWFPVDDLPPLAFDHKRIVAAALDRLRGKVRWAPIGFELLPPRFTLSELQQLYEVILGQALDKRNFRKKIHSMGLLEETDEMRRFRGRGRPARLYRFDRKRYLELTRQGFSFDL